MLVFTMVPTLTIRKRLGLHLPHTLLVFNKYWYPNGSSPKESEQDKLVAELMIRF